MKRTTRLTSLFAAFALTTLPTAATFAQAPGNPPPPPPQGAQPPVPPVPPRPPHPPGAPSHEPITFLGVVTTPPPRVLTEQLNLSPGYGLVVESIVPDSPAAAAGLQRYDVLQMFNDQKLVAVEQLATLVRGTADNTAVNLTLLRKGQPQTVSAKLVRRAPGGGPGRDHASGGDFGDRFRMHFQPHDFFSGFGGGGDGNERGPGRRQLIIRHGDQGRSTTVDGQNAKMVIRDETGEVEVAYKDGKRQVTVRRPNGEEIFSGPVETDEDRKKLPPDALAKLDRLSRERRHEETSRSRGSDNSSNSGGSSFRIEDEDGDFIFENGSSSRQEDAPSS